MTDKEKNVIPIDGKETPKENSDGETEAPSESNELEDESKGEVNDLKDKLLRLRAEFKNYKKRVKKEKSRMEKRSFEKIFRDLLPVMDSLERCVQGDYGMEEGTAQGVGLIYDQFQKFMEKYNVKQLDPEGEEFNPNRHEAVEIRNFPDKKNDSVLEVLDKGYMMDDKILRAAKVIVNKTDQNS